MPVRRQRRVLPLISRIKDGRIFQVSKRARTGIIYLRCQNTRICQGTAKLVEGGIRLINAHSEFCFDDPRVAPIASFKTALQESLRQHWWGLRELYDVTALVYPEAAVWVPYETVRSSMKRWRRRFYPPAPADIRELVDRISQPQYTRNLEYGTGRLSVKLVTDDEGHDHTLIYDAEFVRMEMSNVDRLFIDGTFRSRPMLANAYQLVTVIGIKFNHGIPFMWAVMSRKTQIAYTNLFAYIRDNLIPDVQIRLVMSDFEAALRNAITVVFPAAHSTGCNTHFDRAILKKAKSLGLQREIQRNAAAQELLKTVMALAYLPEHAIQAQFQRIKNQLPEGLRRRFRQFLLYFENYWLGRVKPHRFSVYGLSRRTNNIAESYNSKLGHKLQARPAAWDFVCKLLKLQSHAKADVERLRNNRVISRHARYATIFKHNELVKAWRSLHMRLITTEDFLEKAARLKGDVSQQIRVLRHQDANQLHEEDSGIREPPRVLPLEDDPDYDQQVFAVNPPEWLLRDLALRGNPVNEANGNAGARPQVLHQRVRLGGNDGNNTSPEESDTPSEGSYILDEDAAEIALVADHPAPVHPDEQPLLPDLFVVLEQVDEAPLEPRDHVEEVVLEQVHAAPLEPRVHVEEVVLEQVHAAPLEPRVHVEEVVLEQVHAAPPVVNAPINNDNRNRRKRRKRRNLQEPDGPGPSSAPTAPRGGHRNRRRADKRKRIAAGAVLQARLHIEAAQAEAAAAQLEAGRQRALAEAAQAALDEARAAPLELCDMCVSVPTTHSFFPCGHTCCCGECAYKIFDEDEPVCPRCRNPLTMPPLKLWLQ